MFDDYLFDKTSAEFEKKIIVWDDDHVLGNDKYLTKFIDNNFCIVRYNDDLVFRKKYGKLLRSDDSKILIIANSTQYIPYDIQKRCLVKDASVSSLFKGLNLDFLSKYDEANLNMVALAVSNSFVSLDSNEAIIEFFSKTVLGKENIKQYLLNINARLHNQLTGYITYRDWFKIAEIKAEIDKLAAQYRLEIDTTWISEIFSDWIVNGFGKLSAEINQESPVLVSKAMEFIRDNSDRFVIVVMDGMSEFDWYVLKTSFAGLNYSKTSIFAMIPTVTSISRQCLLSNKFPSQLQDPWSQSKEKNEFIECAKKIGYKDNQIFYGRGYDNDLKLSIKCAAIIINDIDDMVHGQHQDRVGMYNDVKVMVESGELIKMVQRYVQQGLDVYITADHGNTPCVGLGLYRGAGVETTTRSRRMLVVNSLADVENLKEKYPLIEYPQYYLNKEQTYLICEGQASYDSKGDKVMSHGGITIDEVVVPFVKVMARDNNG